MPDAHVVLRGSLVVTLVVWGLVGLWSILVRVVRILGKTTGDKAKEKYLKNENYELKNEAILQILLYKSIYFSLFLEKIGVMYSLTYVL